MAGCGRVTVPDEPGNDQLAVAVDRRPCPYVPGAFRGGLRGRDILILCIGERPYFVALDAPGLDILHVPVVVFGAGLTSVDEELADGIE